MKNCNNGMIIIFSGKTAQSFKYEIKKLAFEAYCKNKFVFLLSKKIKRELNSGKKIRVDKIGKFMLI